jgi:HK97 gp10 family phage protein
VEKTGQKRLNSVGKDLSEKISKAAPSDTGTLRKSVSYKQDGLEVKVTIAAPYWQYVEFGTRRSRAKPFARPTYQKEKQRIAKKLGKRIL